MLGPVLQGFATRLAKFQGSTRINKQKLLVLGLSSRVKILWLPVDRTPMALFAVWVCINYFDIYHEIYFTIFLIQRTMI